MRAKMAVCKVDKNDTAVSKLTDSLLRRRMRW
jgi:hypothetical protein